MTEQVTDTATTSQKVVEVINPANLLKNEIDQMAHIYQIVIDFFTNYSFQIVGAIIIFIIGYILAGKVAAMLLRVCERHNLDVTLSRFIANSSRMLLVLMIAIIALGKLGISVTPFIAAIGAVSLGAGLALQGLLSNYAAGFNIIITRPFVVGDTIIVKGVTGVVKEVLLAHTIIYDEDNVRITIPNKHIVGEILQNSLHDSLLELNVGIAYSENPIEVIALLDKVIATTGVVSKTREPQIGIDEFADSAINISIRLWTPTVNLYTAKFTAYKAIYLALDEANIQIPFPQRDVHMIQPETKI
ncbi:mechanosensitive ion channel family protein [Pseudocolwellia agarivorans]|uniref:mechanosensitive ion channel family protein n=1 Tax=Pseudocolwellia agarivorans TaxID=1911682 RepID=UPI0009867E84|nr:mechanosensitive ion channel family protein [Pseudocolwellia agarivorans]